MRRSIGEGQASDIHPDARPVIRVATEFYLRGFELLARLEGDIVDGLIVMTLACDQMRSPRHGARSTRALSRGLDVPTETVRRHVRGLLQRGHCVSEDGGVAVPASVMRSRHVATFLRRIHAEAERLLGDLTRIGVASFTGTPRRSTPSGRFTGEHAVIAVAATGLLLSCVQALRAFWAGDLTRGMIFTGIWAANVRHVTNSASGASRTVLADRLRQPVSALALARSLRLPYETVRRHADALMRDGVCRRAGRAGLIVPARVHLRIASGAGIAHRLVTNFLSELRLGGVKV